MSGIPEEWVEVTIGDIAKVQSGSGFPKHYQGKTNDTYPFYKVGDISESVKKNCGFLEYAGNYINDEEVEEIRCKFFKEGFILFAKVGEAVKLNRRALVIKKGLADNNVMGIKAVLSEYDTFLFNFMKTVDLSETSRATTIPSVRKSDIEDLAVYFPPLAENNQIQEQLELLLGQVDKIKRRIDGIPAILKSFRQSVLSAAVSGKLTEDWRGTEKFGYNIKLGELAESIRYGTSKKCNIDTGVTPVLRIPNIKNGRVDLSNLKFTNFDEKELKALSLKEGDILIIRSNGSLDLVGKPALITKSEVHCLFAGYLIRIRLDKIRVLPEYVLFCLQSPLLRNKIEINARSTSGVNNINSQELADLVFLLPEYEEQQEIVKRVESYFALVDSIENRVEEARCRIDNLSQSILAKAFSGDLTKVWRELNRDLITGDNSAFALLERIKAEQENLKPKKKITKK